MPTTTVFKQAARAVWVDFEVDSSVITDSLESDLKVSDNSFFLMLSPMNSQTSPAVILLCKEDTHIKSICPLQVNKRGQVGKGAFLLEQIIANWEFCKCCLPRLRLLAATVVATYHLSYRTTPFYTHCDCRSFCVHASFFAGTLTSAAEWHHCVTQFPRPLCRNIQSVGPGKACCRSFSANSTTQEAILCKKPIVVRRKMVYLWNIPNVWPLQNTATVHLNLTAGVHVSLVTRWRPFGCSHICSATDIFRK